MLMTHRDDPLTILDDNLTNPDALKGMFQLAGRLQSTSSTSAGFLRK
jgi:hypothetical protein